MGRGTFSLRSLAVLAAATALPATFASAASLGGLPTSSLGAGGAPIARCDSGFQVGHTTSGGNVVAVTVSDIADPACEGGELSVTLTDAAGSVLASGGPTAIAADGDALPNTVVVALTPAPTAEQVADAHLSVVGP